MLTGPEDFVRPFAAAYARFAIEITADEATLNVELSAEGLLTIGRRSSRFVPGIDPAAQLSHKLQAALMDAIGDHALLHGAALVGDDGCATVLSGPSGHGKSSLALELVSRGFRLLSDDVAPLDLQRSMVAPFPRMLSVIPGREAQLPAAFTEFVTDKATPTMFGKKLIDVAKVSGAGGWMESEVPLGHVIILGDESERPQPATVDLACREEDGDEFLARFTSTSGVRVASSRQDAGSRSFRLELQAGSGAANALAELFDSARILLIETRRPMKADFGGSAELRRIAARPAAERLARELLNRRRDGKLLASRDGSAAELFVDLAGTLAGVQCWTLCGGSTGRRADRIEALTAALPTGEFQ